MLQMIKESQTQWLRIVIKKPTPRDIAIMIFVCKLFLPENEKFTVTESPQFQYTSKRHGSIPRVARVDC